MAQLSMTLSPMANAVTFSPVFTTIPAPSCPKISGLPQYWASQSVWQIPAAIILTSISSPVGSSTEISLIENCPLPSVTAALQ